MFVSIHIPKCGGMSLRHMLRKGCGERLLEDYGDNIHCYLPRFVERRQERQRLVREGGYEQFQFVDVVHGHFYATKYLQLEGDIKWVTFLRHPTTLLPSYYSFLRRKKKGYLADLARSMASLDEFIEHPWFNNIMTRQTEGLGVEDFDSIGFVETYKASSQRLALLMGIPYRRFSRNKNNGPGSGRPLFEQKSSSAEYALTSRQHDLILERNAQDIEFYNAARLRFASEPK